MVVVRADGADKIWVGKLVKVVKSQTGPPTVDIWWYSTKSKKHKINGVYTPDYEVSFRGLSPFSLVNVIAVLR